MKKLNKSIVLLTSTLALTGIITPVINIVTASADSVQNSSQSVSSNDSLDDMMSQIFGSNENESAQENGITYYFSNEEIFKEMEKNGVNVKNILSTKEYNNALNMDMLRQGSNWCKEYTYKGHKRLTVGLNSAIIKVMKYGGQGGVYAIQALMAVRGMPIDAQAAAGMHGTLSSINSEKGHWWHIDLSSFKVVDHGVQ